ncbi:hypothetical protein N7528_006524 [Penicillium herquei]|nr:hypothetical protein N7528_006524 [Penicillium herquei]
MTLKGALLRMNEYCSNLSDTESIECSIQFLENDIDNEEYREAVQREKELRASLIAIAEEDEEDDSQDLALLRKQ